MSEQPTYGASTSTAVVADAIAADGGVGIDDDAAAGYASGIAEHSGAGSNIAGNRAVAMQAAVSNALYEHGLSADDKDARNLSSWAAGLDAKDGAARFDRPPLIRDVQDAALLEKRKAVRASVFAVWQTDDKQRQKQLKTTHNAARGPRGHQPSGAHNRKQAAAGTDPDDRSRTKQRASQLARFKLATDNAKRGMVPGLARRRREEQLLGRSFALEGQRVRVVLEAPTPEQPLSARALELRGRHGTVVRRAVLVAADDRDSFTSSAPAPSEEQCAHCVHVDGVGLVLLQPHEVEP